MVTTTYLAPSLLRRFLEELSSREWDIVEAIAQNRPNSFIARLFCLQKATIEREVSTLYSKLEFLSKDEWDLRAVAAHAWRTYSEEYFRPTSQKKRAIRKVETNGT